MENSQNKKKVQFNAEAWKAGLRRTGEILDQIWKVLFRCRKLLLSIPVIWGALRLAQISMERLGEQVGIGLMSNGRYAYMVSRELAVYSPMAITGVCLLLMFCSRRATYPWLISLFTLCVPVLILVTNVFPA